MGKSNAPLQKIDKGSKFLQGHLSETEPIVSKVIEPDNNNTNKRD